MKIGIDARMYGKISRGIGRYIEELIKNLEQLDTQNQYYIFLHSKNFHEYQPQNKNFKKVLAPWRWYTLAEQIKFPKLLLKYNLDLVHFPHFNVPYIYKKPFVVTIHDLILYKDSQKRATTLGPVKYFLKKQLYKKIISHAIFGSKKIIAISNHTKNDLIETFHVSSQKISTIYNGLSTFKPQNQNDKSIILGYNIDNPYILYVGSAYPHKNLEQLIKVFVQIRKTKKWDLVLVGKIDFFYKRLQRFAKEQQISQHVKFLGYVPDEKMPALYNNCLTYVFPSRYEGFGLPGLEAMANNSAVVSSNTSSLPEIFGNAAIYFDPNSKQDIKNKILQVATNKKLKQQLIFNGQKRIKQFDWNKTAQQTLEIYHNA